jgi:ATP-dependent DNA helicase RecG
LNDRQRCALAYARDRGSISLGVYRELCPGWSPETLRLDLADLVQRGILAKNGRKKGTRYVFAG